MNKGSLMLMGMTMAIMGVTTGCGSPVSFNGAATTASLATAGNSTNPIDVQDAVPNCEIDIPQIQLMGNLNAFEFSTSGGITFGYNQGGTDSGVGGSASVLISSAKMDLSVTAVDPMMSTVLASTDVTANQTQTNIGVTIDFNQFNISPTYASSTPLATMTSNGLTTGVANIKAQTDKIAWVGRVLEHLNASTVVINMGSTAGVQVGDKFDLQNVNHYWAGTPCNSTYYGNNPDSLTPEETIVIFSVGANIATGNVIAQNGAHAKQGAEVLVNTLVAPAKGAAARYLKKSAIVGQITADPITLPGGGTYDWTGVLNSQAVNVLNSSAAYVFSTGLSN